MKQSFPVLNTLVSCVILWSSVVHAQTYFVEQQPKLIPPAEHIQGGEWFGSVSLSGDTALIGAMMDNEKSRHAGSVFVYGRNSQGQWVSNDQLFADTPQPFGLFGVDSVIQGDYAYIGAWGDSHSGQHQAGSVFIYQWDGSEWVSTMNPIRADDAGALDLFGVGIAIQEDLLLIGASTGDDDGEGGSGIHDCGVVYVFERDQQGDWIQQGRFAAPPGECHPHDGFGADIAIEGDLVLVGAWLDDGPGEPKDAGAAYLFRRNPVTGEFDFEWKFEAQPGDRHAHDNFGEAVVLQGDMVLIGAHHWDEDTHNHHIGLHHRDAESTRHNVGAVYIYRRDGSGIWNEVQPKLLAPDRETNDLFGSRLAMEGDTLMVGALGDDEDGWSDCGSVYVYEWIDHDFDGVADSIDECPNTMAGVEVDGLGCPLEDIDARDGDSTTDWWNFPEHLFSGRWHW